jgi:mannose/fructose/N-acetylgalactosamine-specific phosphotransferase system component IIB
VTVVLTRVDQRLVHGQISVAWFTALRFNAVGVADDRAAADPFERELLAGGAPHGVAVDVRPVGEAAPWYGEDASVRRLVLVASLASLRDLIRSGASVTSANLGGLHFRDGARRYLDFLYLTREDIEILRELAQLDVELVAQDLPGRSALVLNPALAEGLLEYDQLRSGPA